MRAVVQRVEWARVSVDAERVGAVERGLCVFVGVGANDTSAEAALLADKIAGLRIFEDEGGKMNLSVLEVGGAVLAISQFTLFGDARRGRRPSFAAAMEPERARELFDEFVSNCRSRGLPIETGRFRAHMRVELSNDGPVTLLLDTERVF